MPLRFWWVPAALVGVAAALVLLNGVALLSASFYDFWSGIFTWLPALGPLAVILGIMLGLVLIGAMVIMFFGFKILSVFVILPTAIVSLFIGGGFIIGAVLAVLAGILLLI